MATTKFSPVIIFPFDRKLDSSYSGLRISCLVLPSLIFIFLCFVSTQKVEWTPEINPFMSGVLNFSGHIWDFEEQTGKFTRN